MEGVRVVSVPASDQDRVRDFHTEALSFEPRTEYTLAEVSDGEVRGRVMDDGERFEFEAGIRVVVRESLEVERPR